MYVKGGPGRTGNMHPANPTNKKSTPKTINTMSNISCFFSNNTNGKIGFFD